MRRPGASAVQGTRDSSCQRASAVQVACSSAAARCSGQMQRPDAAANARGSSAAGDEP